MLVLYTKYLRRIDFFIFITLFVSSMTKKKKLKSYNNIIFYYFKVERVFFCDFILFWAIYLFMKKIFLRFLLRMSWRFSRSLWLMQFWVRFPLSSIVSLESRCLFSVEYSLKLKKHKQHQI